jgi:transaldolase
MPDQTIEASRDHATAKRTVDQDVEGAHQVIADVKAAGVDFERIVMKELVDEGVKSFGDSYDSLIESIKEKAAQLVHAG